MDGMPEMSTSNDESRRSSGSFEAYDTAPMSPPSRSSRTIDLRMSLIWSVSKRSESVRLPETRP